MKQLNTDIYIPQTVNKWLNNQHIELNKSTVNILFISFLSMSTIVRNRFFQSEFTRWWFTTALRVCADLRRNLSLHLLHFDLMNFISSLICNTETRPQCHSSHWPLYYRECWESAKVLILRAVECLFVNLFFFYFASLFKWHSSSHTEKYRKKGKNYHPRSLRRILKKYLTNYIDHGRN